MHFGEILKFGAGSELERAPIEKEKIERKESKEEKQDTDATQQQRFSPRTVSLGAVWVKQYTISLTVLLNKDRKQAAVEERQRTYP